MRPGQPGKNQQSRGAVAAQIRLLPRRGHSKSAGRLTVRRGAARYLLEVTLLCLAWGLLAANCVYWLWWA